MEDLGLAQYWNSRRVFVTGVTGFKGAWLSLWLEQFEAEQSSLSLPPIIANSLYDKLSIRKNGHHHFADIRDADAVNRHMDAAQPEVVIHMAAQALVQRSYADPIETYTSNVLGTLNVLEAARRGNSVKTILIVTSDKVYANHGNGLPFVEGDRLGGRDPYSASKACTELISDSYRQTYFRERGIKLATVRAGNVIGGGDWAEGRLVPDIMRASANGQPVLLRNPKAVRPWQHVLEPLLGYLRYAKLLAEHDWGTVPAALNFGPAAGSTITVSALAEAFGDRLGFDVRREGEQDGYCEEAMLLTLDSQRAGETLGWHPRLTIDQTVDWTADWYRVDRLGGDMREYTLQQIAAYGELA